MLEWGSKLINTPGSPTLHATPRSIETLERAHALHKLDLPPQICNLTGQSTMGPQANFPLRNLACQQRYVLHKAVRIPKSFANIQYLSILQSLKKAGIAGFDIKIFGAGRVAGAPAAAEIPRPRCVSQAGLVSNGRSSGPSRFSGFSVGFRGSVRLGKSPTSFRVACKCRRRPTVPVPVPVGKQ